MKVYHVSLNLLATEQEPERSYGNLLDEIKKTDSMYAALGSDTFWFVYTDETAMQIRDRLERLVGKNDTVFVNEVTATSHSGYIPETSLEWLRRRLNIAN